jgi:hypothetical protein
MKQILSLILATFILTAVHAGGKPYKAPLNIKPEASKIQVSLQAAGKVNISWTAVDAETTATIYQIQKRTGKEEFKTVAILMGESYPTYSFRDKLNATSGTIEYRVIATEHNVIISTVSQELIVL